MTSVPRQKIGAVTRVWSNSSRDTIVDAVFPPRCAGGSETSIRCEIWSHEIFCPICAVTLQPIVAPLCHCCGAPMRSDVAAAICADCRDNRYHAAPPFDGVRSVFHYVGAVRPAIHRFKYDGKTALAAPLAQFLTDYLRTSSTRPCAPNEIDMLVPVPLHRWRQWRRGFNQSELLAREIGRELKLPVRHPLQRTRLTPPQVELSREERQQNVKGIFTLRDNNKAHLEDATVLLIDDVFTTGATLAECALVLKNAGAARVYGLTLARSGT